MRLRELGRACRRNRRIPPQALLNFEAMTKMLLERGHVRLPEGELIAFRRMNDPYLAGAPSIDGRTQQAIAAAIQAPDYAAVKIPALAIYAFDDPDKPLPPWYDPNDKELMATLAERARISDAMKRESIELFRAQRREGTGAGDAERHALHHPVEPAGSAGRHREVCRRNERRDRTHWNSLS